ncbi:hypothetical protein [Roseovarius tolerans]|nr:hypothetical protein [Roseovarius tolerans]
MAHQTCASIPEPLPGKGVHERSQFRLDRLFGQLAHATAKIVGEWGVI